jgi:uncharacterized membrane protein YphA (DoxX/SURF4 family)
MSWVMLAILVVLSALFVVAATGKLLNADDFVTALRLSRLPERTIAPLAVVVPVLEMLLALALVLAPARRLPVAFAAAGLMLAIFTLWMGWIHARRLRVRCGCFGGGGAEIGPRSIGRNLLLLLMAVGGLVLTSRTSSPLPPPTLPFVVAVTSLAMCLALAQTLHHAWPHLITTYERYQAKHASASGE